MKKCVLGLISMVAMAGCSEGPVAIKESVVSEKSSSVGPSSKKTPAIERMKFLQTIPEFSDFHMKITEDELFKRIEGDDLQLDIEIDRDNDYKSYTLTNRKGKCVVVMFKAGACCGIQRLN